MTLFGKLLLVFNLVAGGAFVYFATKDWKGRQSINAAGHRHLILLQGVPLDGPDTFSADDETKFAIEGPGGVPTKTVSKKLLEGYFQAAPPGDRPTSLHNVPGPVPTQLAELKRVKARVEDILAKTESDAEKVQLLRGWLLYQVETFDERLEILELTANEKLDTTTAKPFVRAKNAEEVKQDAENLQKRLLARFDAILAPPAVDPAATTALTDADLEGKTDEERAKIIADKSAKVAESRLAPLTEDQRRTKLAHLLIHLSPEAAWQKRVMLVVGLRRYVSTVAAQIPRFEDMSTRLDNLIILDDTGFRDQLGNYTRIAHDYTELVNHQRSLRTKWVAQAIKDADLLAQRTTQFKTLEAQLTKITNEVNALLAKQTQTEAELFEVQREVAITLDEVYKLEEDLKKRERKLLGLDDPTPGKKN
jgi:hypothetical protein